MAATISTTSPKPRTQVIWGTWNVDGVTYSGRRIDVDSLCHLEWIDTTPPAVSEASVEYLNTKPLTAWEKEFVGTIANCLMRGWDVSEKRLAVWNKICLKHQVTDKDVSSSAASLSGVQSPAYAKSRGTMSTSSVSDGSGTYSQTTVTDPLDEIPF